MKEEIKEEIKENKHKSCDDKELKKIQNLFKEIISKN